MKKLILVLAFAGILALSVSAQAAVITVDGSITGTEWNYVAGDTHWLHAGDVNEPGITNDNYDASDLYITDDGTNMYFRFDVYGIASLGSSQFYAVYIDADQNPATGELWEGIGRDAYIKFYKPGASYITDVATWNQVGGYWNSAVSGVGAQNTITELKATYAQLGIGSPEQKIDIRGYVDGGNTDPDDLIPNSPAGYPNIPEPTSMSLLGLGLIGAIAGLIRRK